LVTKIQKYGNISKKCRIFVKKDSSFSYVFKLNLLFRYVLHVRWILVRLIRIRMPRQTMYANAISSSTSGSPMGVLAYTPIGSASDSQSPSHGPRRGPRCGAPAVVMPPSEIYGVLPTIGVQVDVERN
jgi:hypothetical protein